MSLVNIISALGNNNSIYPLLVRDCGIENVAKCYMTYKQNAKESEFIAKQATRERIIDEYGTSAVWLGGIPLLNKVCDKLIDLTGLSSKVDTALIKGSGFQSLEKNIDTFKGRVSEEIINNLSSVADNKKLFQGLQIGKFVATTTIPIILMGFILPKLNFSYTKKKLCTNKQEYKPFTPSNFDEFKSSLNKNKQVSFKGLEKLANMSDLEKMMILDGGLTVGRVRTGRNKQEKGELAFKMAGMCFLNYIAPKWLEKGFNKITKNIFGINTNLDVKLLDSQKFISAIKSNSLELPQNLDEKSILDFIDQNPNSIFVEEAKKLKLVSFLDGNIRDPRKFVNTGEIASLKESISEFAEDAIKSGSVEKFAKKALKAKSFNTILNIGTSSLLLAYVLPKVQFLLRKLITGTNADPAISEIVDKKA